MAEVKAQKVGYAIRRVVGSSLEETLERTRQVLKDAGFGVLTEIDMQAKLKEKLDKDFRNYAILGACNPGFALEALDKDLDIGLLLPCNVIVYENGESTVVSAIDPEKAMSIAEVPGLDMIATQVGAKLRSALDSI